MIRSKRALEAQAARPTPEVFTLHPRHPNTSITPGQVIEMIKCHTDPKYFIENYLKINHPGNGPIPLKLKPYQANIIDVAEANGELIVVQPRQSGATMIPTALQLQRAIFEQNQNIVISVISVKMIPHIQQMVAQWINDLPDWMKPSIKYYNRNCFEFTNGSRILISTITGNSLRGLSINSLFVDNMAWAAERDQIDFWHCAAPMLAHGGKILLSGTPHGPKNTFANIWNVALHGSSPRQALKVAGREAHTLAHLQRMASMLGVDQYMREYEGSFA